MKKIIFKGIISGVILIFVSFPLLAAIINVPVDYATIQEGINAAGYGDTVLVAAGTYVENISLRNGIILEGTGAEVTIIDGDANGPVVDIYSNTEIKGFSIINGFTGEYTGNMQELAGIYCAGSGVSIRDNIIDTGSQYGIYFCGFSTTSSAINNVICGHERYGLCIGFDSPLIENNVIRHNNWSGIRTWNAISNPTIRNNTVFENNNGILFKNNIPIIENNIVVNNTNVGIGEEFSIDEYTFHYNNVYGNGDDYYQAIAGVGAISADPLFVNSAGNDYHLQAGSPCIDAGNPGVQYNDLDGTRNDMGAYGGSNAKDFFAPVTTGHNPAINATEVPMDTNIVVSVRDNGEGVNIDFLVMTVEGITIVPSITGIPAEYVLTYDPPVNFNYGQEINVTIDASDLADPVNVMAQHAYSFIIEQAKIPFAEDLSQAKTYPNPYKGNYFSGITFDSLTEGSKIKIYTLSGQLIKEIEVSDEGMVFWDVKNEQGKKIASGIYIYLIVDEKGNKKTGKIAIIK